MTSFMNMRRPAALFLRVAPQNLAFLSQWCAIARWSHRQNRRGLGKRI
jgi:hypothetical protein